MNTIGSVLLRHKPINIALLSLALLATTIAMAKIPAEIRNTAGYRTAEMLMKQCTSAQDALLCLSEKGAICSPQSDRGAETYRCEMEISVEATKLKGGTRKPEHVGEYLVEMRISNSRKGWSGEIDSVTLLSN